MKHGIHQHETGMNDFLFITHFSWMNIVVGAANTQGFKNINMNVP